jgi:hypothetical protein
MGDQHRDPEGCRQIETYLTRVTVERDLHEPGNCLEGGPELLEFMPRRKQLVMLPERGTDS